MRLLDPIAITGADFDVALIPDGIQAPRAPGKVRCANESAYALKITGLAGDAHWLQPWTVDVYDARDASTFHVHPVQLVTPLPPAPFASLLVTIADPVETIPGAYPASLDRQSASYSQQVRLGQVTAGAGANVVSAPFPVPVGIQSIGFMVESGTPANVVVIGSPSGLVYLDEPNPVQAPYVEPFGPTEDTAAQLQVDNTGGATSATAVLIGYPILFSHRPFSAPALPQAWEAATDASVSLASLLNGSSTATVVAGVAQKKIRVLNVYFEGSGVTIIHYQDAAGKRIAGGQAFAANTTSIPPMDCKGVPCGVGQALQLVNDTATATTHTSVVGWTQTR